MTPVLELTFLDTTRRAPRKNFFERIVKRVLKGEHVKGNILVSVLVAGDQRVQKLNRTYRNKDRTTDVLSFPAASMPGVSTNARELGELVISLPQAERQARKMKHARAWELELLTIHGILHLLGYDHERSKKDEARMQARERAYLSPYTF